MLCRGNHEGSNLCVQVKLVSLSEGGYPSEYVKCYDIRETSYRVGWCKTKLVEKENNFHYYRWGEGVGTLEQVVVKVFTSQVLGLLRRLHCSQTRADTQTPSLLRGRDHLGAAGETLLRDFNAR